MTLQWKKEQCFVVISVESAERDERRVREGEGEREREARREEESLRSVGLAVVAQLPVTATVGLLRPLAPLAHHSPSSYT